MLNNFKKEFSVFAVLFWIQTKYWFANPLNIFLGVFITIYTVLCWLAFKSNDHFLMISGIGIAMTRNSMYIYLRTLVDWRVKGFRDKMQMSDINSFTKHASLFVFNFVVSFLICALLFIISVIFFPQQIDIPSTNGIMLATGLILCWITCYMVAIFIYVVITNRKWAILIGLLLYFTSMYFLGLGFPFATIINYDWLNYLLFLHPMRYTVNIIQAAYVNAVDFHYIYQGELIVDFGYSQLTWLPYLLAFVVIGIASVGAILKISIERNYKFRSKSTIKKLKSESKAYIKRIKETNDIELLKEIREDRIGEI